MKKLFILLLFIILFSCEKEVCWECKIQQTETKVIIQQYCNKTIDEITAIENSNTFVHNLYGEFYHQTCTCIQIK